MVADGNYRNGVACGRQRCARPPPSHRMESARNGGQVSKKIPSTQRGQRDPLVSDYVPFRASASIARSLSDGGLNLPGLMVGEPWAASTASFSAGSTRR